MFILFLAQFFTRSWRTGCGNKDYKSQSWISKYEALFWFFLELQFEFERMNNHELSEPFYTNSRIASFQITKLKLLPLFVVVWRLILREDFSLAFFISTSNNDPVLYNTVTSGRYFCLPDVIWAQWNKLSAEEEQDCGSFCTIGRILQDTQNDQRSKCCTWKLYGSQWWYFVDFLSNMLSALM